MKLLMLLLSVFVTVLTYGQSPEEKLIEMGILLPEAPSPPANYVNAVRVGNLLFLAGKGPTRADGTYITGKLGGELSIAQGYEAAYRVAINQIAVLKQELGDLSRVKRIVKALCLINSTPEFTDHPKVTNGFSDTMVQVFGDKGKHARSSVGMCSLPFNIAVEIELIVEIED
jgi:enamine deaminase RidA (YjgF/YER057c/UK114 family)